MCLKSVLRVCKLEETSQDQALQPSHLTQVNRLPARVGATMKLMWVQVQIASKPLQLLTNRMFHQQIITTQSNTSLFLI